MRKRRPREAALNSFELAYDVKAAVLIVNLGRVDINLRLEQALHDAYRSGGKTSENFQGLTTRTH